MLTKSDIDQIGKLVRKIVREEVETEIRDVSDHLEARITLAKMELLNRFGKLDDRVKNVEIKVNGLEKVIKDIQKRVKKTEKTVDIAINMFNQDDAKLQKRVEKIEEHLDLPSKN